MITKKVPSCSRCTVMKCRYPRRKGKAPEFCAAEKYLELKKETVNKNWTDPEIKKINLAWENVMKNDVASASITGNRWTRIKEIMEYAKYLKYKKIGLAFCVAFFREVRILHDILEKNGFEVASICCMAGREGSLVCNPLFQAEVLNREGTELNIMLGLCMGHDVLFIRHSKADVTPLVIKDRALNHNPIEALHSQEHRRRLSLQESRTR